MGNIAIKAPLTKFPHGPVVLAGFVDGMGESIHPHPVVSDGAVEWLVPDNDRNRRTFRRELEPGGFTMSATSDDPEDGTGPYAVAADRDQWKARAEKAESELADLKAHAEKAESGNTDPDVIPDAMKGKAKK